METLPLGRSPDQLFAPLAERLGAAFLDSALFDEHGLGRWSFLVWDPFAVLTAQGMHARLTWGGVAQPAEGHPLEVLRGMLQRCRTPRREMPFWSSGAVGYLAYDFGRTLERLPAPARDDFGLPDLYFGFYDFCLAYEHSSGVWHLAGDAVGGPGRPSLDDRRREILALAATPPPPDETATSAGLEFRSNFNRENYLAAIVRAQQYILDGEIYQVNLSQRFSADWPGPGWSLYRRLRQANPAPFAAFLAADGCQVLSSSPERFLRLTDGVIETRPIKGTRPRGTTPAEDAGLAQELLHSEKDRAELNMIVDLLRNDLGRVAEYGSVEVPRHAALESYARVHHLVSTVTGRLRPDQDAADLIRAAFPGGSITGAPKIRAMQIIAELEPTARSVYTGALGWIGFNGDLDLNIAIRTMLLANGRLSFQVGGGIVADSDPAAEYQETLDKARALFEACTGQAAARRD